MIAPTTPLRDEPGIRAPLGGSTAPSLELVPSMAHELRAPLASLAAAAELMQTSEPVEQRRLAEIIHRQAYRMSGIVDAVLQMYAASNACGAQPREPVDLPALLNDLCADQALSFPHHAFKAHARAACSVTADRHMLGMVMTNLLSNAAKYSPPGSTVSVSTRRDGDEVLVEVEDEGNGVPPEFRRRIFEPGYRTEHDRSDSYGLGLFIADRLCMVMRGSLSVEPAARASGARFIVRLPLHGGGSLDSE